MPIYAYKCSACGYAKDVLQKISDAPLTECPQCQQASFSKQLTAPGFQLKGTGWYATDFSGKKASSDSSTAGASSSSSADSKPAAAPAPAASAPAAAPSGSAA
ncbi:FmdB family zinc ribbon protein [Comamonas sp. J-3]|jgi:putative FmdB family regulatory protein|uniref:FmdB family zinc ribbon protein n=1 Tax=Comamonas trifloxystrobinivorans TaxID=3350256 RepID=UPI00372CBA4C